MKTRYWLMKSEPSDYSFDDLKLEVDSTAEWDGVRSYQARNLLRDEIKVGDKVNVEIDPIARYVKRLHDYNVWNQERF